MKRVDVWRAIVAAWVAMVFGAAGWGAGELMKDKGTVGGAGTTMPARAAAPEVKDPHQRMNLFGKPEKARFELKDRDWPAKVGEGSVCLWKDDCLAAMSMGMDDNNASNIPWWLAMSKKYGLRPSWWVISGIVDSSNANGGTWETWRKILAAGFDVQSHSVNHLNTKSPTWTGKMDDEYGNSRKMIEEKVPGAKCLTLAYPGGVGQEINDPAIAARYYIAARTGYPLINPANMIDYLNVNGGSQFNVDDAKWPEMNLTTAFINTPKNKYFRGWWVGFTHYVDTNNPATVATFERKFGYIQGKVKSGDLWMGLFREVAEYGQERDTGKLSIKSISGKIVITLNDDMDDTIFDFPLTVKVHIDPTWKNVKATQAGKEISCVAVRHDNATFELVQIVPDKGEVEIVPAK